MNTQTPAPINGQPKDAQLTAEHYLPLLLKSETILKILESSQLVTTRAKEVSAPIIKDFINANLKSLSDLQLVELGSKLENIQGRCIVGIEKQNKGRSPLTQAFDLVRAKFTAEENAVSAIKQQCSTYRGLINAEIKRRKDEQAKSTQNTVNASNEEIDYRAQFTAHLKKELIKFIRGLKNECRTKINKSSDLLQTENNLKKWEPTLRADLVNTWGEQFKFELFYLKEKPSFDVPLEELENIFKSEMLPEKAFLLQEVALRIAGITTDPVSLIGENEVIKEIAATTQATEIQAASEKLEASFAATSGAPSMLPTIGEVPQKYTPATHEHWAKIIAWYVTDEMPHLTAEELKTKFGFMLTKANNVLNATKQQIVGVPREDNFTATGSRAGRKPKKEKEVA